MIRRPVCNPVALEPLERRALFAATVVSPIGDYSRPANSGADAVDLSTVFSDPNTVVRFSTVAGDMDVELFNDDVPATVANFRSYVNFGSYDQTIIHGSQPGSFIQGGGYDTQFNHILVDPPVAVEPVFSNVRGTIAMVKLTENPGAFTSEWFFNLADNSAFDADGSTVFGRVVPGDLGVIDGIAGIPTFEFDEPFGALPLIDYVGFGPIPPENTVLVTDVRELPLFPGGSDGDSVLEFSVSSDNPALVSPSLEGSQLVLEYGAGQTGVANVTVRATDRGGNFVDDTFQVNVAADPGDVQDTDTVSIPDFTEIADVAVQPDGKFVLVGYRLIAGDNDFVIARLNADRTLDTSFAGDGSITLDVDLQDDRATAVAIDAQGRIVVVGTSGVITDEDEEVTESNFVVARFLSNGTPDASFGGGEGFVEEDFNTARASVDEANGVALQPDGKIVVVGASDTGDNGTQDFALARFNEDGSIDPTFFSPGGGKTSVDFSNTQQDDVGEDIVLLPNGSIVVTGYTASGGVISAFATLRFGSDGVLDTTFGVGGGVRTNFNTGAGPGAIDQAYSVDVQPDGKIVVGGLVGVLNFLDITFTADFGIVRYNPDGSLDQSFGINGGTITDFGFIEGINRVVVQDDGRIIASGQAAFSVADAVNEDVFAVIARYNPNGFIDTTFGINGGVVLFQETGAARAGLLRAATGNGAFASLLADVQAAAAAEDGDLERRFDQFAAEAQGIVAVTRGGAITAFAADNGLVRIGVVTGGGPPVIVIAAESVNATGLTSTVIVVQASDDTAVSVASLNGNANVLEVITPGGGALSVVFVSLDNAADAATVVARFRVDAPGGTWDASENGTYTVRLRGDQVRDADGQAAAAADVGTFSVSVPSAPADGPDLVVAGVTGVRQGSFIGGAKGGAASILVQNKGNRPLAAPVTVSLFFSSDQVVDGSDGPPLLTFTKTLKLKLEAAKALKTKFNYPADRPDGDYFILARLDGPGAVAETNESNNDGSNGFTVKVARPFVDLKGTLAPVGGAFTAGKAGRFAVNLSNGGNTPVRAAVAILLFASTDSSRDAADVQLNDATRATSLSLKAAAGKALTVKFTVPANLPPGSYFLIVEIDPDNRLPESDEANTLTSTSQFTIVV